MSEVTAKRVLLKNKEGEYLLPKVAVANAPEEGNEDPITSDAVKAAIDAAIKSAPGGSAIGTVFAYPGAVPPKGAYLLNGQTIAGCNELYPKFWEWVQSAGVRIIDNATYEAEIASAGVCGGFVINSVTGSVRLPTLVNGTLWGADRGTIGQSLLAGLPNITGTLYMTDSYSSGHADGTNGAFSLSKVSGSYMDDNGFAGTRTNAHFDASRSNPIYGNSDTVQPPAIRVSWCIQVYNAATALSEQESAQLASQMQMKAQTDLANVNSNIDFVVESWSDGADGWYRKYRSGWVEQGGTMPKSVTSGTVTFPVEMRDISYVVTAVDTTRNESNTDTEGAGNCIYLGQYTVTGFRFSRESGRYADWVCYGYAATE